MTRADSPVQASDGPAVGRLEAMYAGFRDADVQGLWTLPGLLTPVPAARAVPHRWDGRILGDLAASSPTPPR